MPAHKPTHAELYDIASNKLFLNKMKKIFSEYDINCVVDVGANLGQYYDFVRKSGYKGVVFSFEPKGLSI